MRGWSDEWRDSRLVEGVLVEVPRTDPNPIVRHEAAFGLGRLYSQHKAADSDRIDGLCAAALSDRSSVVRHEAAESLGEFPYPQARQSLRLLLDDPDEDVVETARISLARLSQLAPP